MDKKTLTSAQIQLVRTLADRHELTIPWEVQKDYDFAKRFLDLFAFDPNNTEMTGLRRTRVIESYCFYDKENAHLAQKLELSLSDIRFMVMVLSRYKYDGALPREKDEPDRDPEDEYYKKMEKLEWEAACWKIKYESFYAVTCVFIIVLPLFYILALEV